MYNAEPQVDQRQYARFELLEYAIARRDDDPEPIRSVVTDISLGGLQIRSRAEFEVGRTYQIEIGRTTASPLALPVEVRYCRPIEESDLFAAGLRCLPRSASERTAWVDYVHGIFQTFGERLLDRP